MGSNFGSKRFSTCRFRKSTPFGLILFIFFSRHVETKAAYEASRPTESTYKVDETEEVFATIEKAVDDEEEQKPMKKMKPKMKKKKKIAVPT